MAAAPYEHLLHRAANFSIPQLAILGTTTLPKPTDRATMRVSVERTGIIAASSLMKEDGVGDEQPIGGLGEVQVGGWFALGESNAHLYLQPTQVR